MSRCSQNAFTHTLVETGVHKECRTQKQYWLVRCFFRTQVRSNRQSHRGFFFCLWTAVWLITVTACICIWMFPVVLRAPLQPLQTLQPGQRAAHNWEKGDVIMTSSLPLLISLFPLLPAHPHVILPAPPSPTAVPKAAFLMKKSLKLWNSFNLFFYFSRHPYRFTFPIGRSYTTKSNWC